jgi:hypothetical protein
MRATPVSAGSNITLAQSVLAGGPHLLDPFVQLQQRLLKI